MKLDPELYGLLDLKSTNRRYVRTISRQGNSSIKKRGLGMEYQDIRPYEFGDDARYIDWNVLSRTGDLYCKEFQPEESMPILVVLDASPSMSDDKRKAAFQTALFLSFFHLKQKNTVRWFVYGINGFQLSNILRTPNLVYAYSNSVLNQKSMPCEIESTWHLMSKSVKTWQYCYWISDFANWGQLPLGFLHNLRWYQIGIWVEYEEVENPLPFWLSVFATQDSESTYSSRYTIAKSDFLKAKELFSRRLFKITADRSLAPQVSEFLTQL